MATHEDDHRVESVARAGYNNDSTALLSLKGQSSSSYVHISPLGSFSAKRKIVSKLISTLMNVMPLTICRLLSDYQTSLENIK